MEITLIVFFPKFASDQLTQQTFSGRQKSEVLEVLVDDQYFFLKKGMLFTNHSSSRRREEV